MWSSLGFALGFTAVELCIIGPGMGYFVKAGRRFYYGITLPEIVIISTVLLVPLLLIFIGVKRRWCALEILGWALVIWSTYFEVTHHS